MNKLISPFSQSENGPDEFVPEIVHLSGIENIVDIEKICRERIKENDPTPPLTKKLKES